MNNTLYRHTLNPDSQVARGAHAARVPVSAARRNHHLGLKQRAESSEQANGTIEPSPSDCPAGHRTAQASGVRSPRRFFGRYRSLHGLLLAVLSTFSVNGAHAQTNFPIIALPTQIGAWQRAYVGTNVDAISLIGQPGGPQPWDFSQPMGPHEYTLRTEVVHPSDGEHDASFPRATFAVRETVERDDSTSWSFYSVTANQGRLYHGFYDPNTEASGEVVFDTPATDLPANVTLGQTWQWQADYLILVLGFPVDVHVAVSARADAYGVIVLPGIGVVPALRVSEVRSNAFSFFTQLLGSQVNTTYFWLAGGIGTAARVTLYGSNPLVATPLPYTNSVFRVFQARPWTASDLRLRVQGSQTTLTWRPETDTSGYQVEMRPDLSPASAWQFLTDTTGSTHSETFLPAEPQRFFRVLVKP